MEVHARQVLSLRYNIAESEEAVEQRKISVREMVAVALRRKVLSRTVPHAVNPGQTFLLSIVLVVENV